MSRFRKTLLRKRRKKESLFKYIMGVLHLWFGLLSGLVIVVVCLSGCVYAFKNQFTDLLNKEKVFVKATETPKKTPAEIQINLEKEGKNLTGLTISNDPKRSYVVTYQKDNSDVATYYDPYTGKELGMGDTNLNQFFEVVLDIHRNLMMGEVGRQINGVAILMFCVLLLSGLVLWIPKKWKYWKQAFTVKFSGKFQRINYDLHNTMGFYAFLLLFFMAVTGLYVTYPWMKNTLIVSLGGDSISGVSQENQESNSAFDAIFSDMLNRQNEKAELKEEPSASLETILRNANQILPYEAVTAIEFPNKDNPRFVISKINTNNWLGAMLPDQITLDKTGVVKSKDLFWEKPLHQQFTTLVKPLHTGEILGLKSIILYFIVCFIGFSLPVTGFIFWFNKFRKAK
ncbi:PepSY-associated TM helix domain-containing protein [Chryseobacterium lacus]|uniref:PepSY-associated TM helix domain-containing protein n=1 Tax=Chryseobacterium lacus TaxID=2058346 RepID=UPI000F870E2D|nr:PepSY-associated TM helix domain-containing protein [Chryseobacterium lacus]RST29224.1 PepSY domain-containing protein [Chryseobacterium lacus]